MNAHLSEDPVLAYILHQLLKLLVFAQARRSLVNFDNFVQKMNYALGPHFLQVLGHLKEACHVGYRIDGHTLLLKLNLVSLLGHLVVRRLRYLLFF